MSWTHGTTGGADICAPSRASADHPAQDYIGQMNETLAKWVERGYAVTKTDYQGLGTDGVHSYLIGVAEARATADITIAVHELSAELSREWVVNGHSQGGQAALFTAEIGQLRAPTLALRGAVAQAPPSQTRDMHTAARNSPREGAPRPRRAGPVDPRRPGPGATARHERRSLRPADCEGD
jgi:alpha-beta hydrolase superfamily lysophospholipase